MIRRACLPRGVAPPWLDGASLAYLADVGLPHSLEYGGTELYGRLSFASLAHGLASLDADLDVLGVQTMIHVFGGRTIGEHGPISWCVSRATGQVRVHAPDSEASLRFANTSVEQLGSFLDALLEWGAGRRPRSLARLRAAWQLADRPALAPGAEWSMLLEWLGTVADADMVCRQA